MKMVWMMAIDYMRFGNRIKIKRKSLNLSQEELAEKCHCTNKHISNVERGRTKPSIDTLIHITNALSTTPDELLYGSFYKSKEFIRDDISAILALANENQTKVVAKAIAAIIDEWNLILSNSTSE